MHVFIKFTSKRSIVTSVDKQFIGNDIISLEMTTTELIDLLDVFQPKKHGGYYLQQGVEILIK